jgi:hypothetical protein
MNRYPLDYPEYSDRTPSHKRQRANFTKDKKRLSVADAYDRLMIEIKSFTRCGHSWVIDPDKVIISSNISVKHNGQPYSGRAEPDDTGVAVYFKRDGRDYCFPCDKWDRVADNIAAIAAHLNAMRGQERWGVGSIEQAFKGYLSLPMKIGWYDVLGVKPTANESEVKEAYIRLSKIAHPDLGGNTESQQQINQAIEEWKIIKNQTN